MSEMSETVLICGSREWDDFAAIHEAVEALPLGSTVIHGGARGVDTIAGGFAHRRGLTVKFVRAEWERWGRAAGFIRNLAMLDECPDRVIAFQCGQSRGTQHTINEALKRDIPVTVVRA
jgi:hypothetical protein